MKTILKTAVLFAAIILGITACTDEAKEKLIVEMNSLKPEFLAVDSSLSAIRAFINQRKDSLVRVADSDPKRKSEIDSILLSGSAESFKLDSLATVHLLQTTEIDSLKSGMEQGGKSTEQVTARWEMMKTDHREIQQYAKELDKAVLFLLVSETGKDSLAKEPVIKKEK